jgi:hypothetical protein
VLIDRLGAWVTRVKQDRSLPWVGTTMLGDLETITRLLNLREFGEWLRVEGSPQQAQFGGELVDTVDALDDIERAMDEQPGGDAKSAADKIKALVAAEERHETEIAAIEEAAGVSVEELPGEVARLREAAAEAEAMRDVLVEVGALSPHDRSMPLDDLLRALLS